MASNKNRKNLEREILGEGTGYKLIVGIDYGTTFSGISYATTYKGTDINHNTVITFSKWPGTIVDSWKAPTRLAYSKENPSLSSDKWGYEVESRYKSYSWTKLLLDKGAASSRFDDPELNTLSGYGMMRLPPFRDAQGVCQDFLAGLYTYAMGKLKQTLGEDTLDKTPMECWITLPAIWSEEAKVSTLKAAKAAGFGSRPSDEVFTISEPEAAAIATLKVYSEPNMINSVKKGEHILICDCGGGTVDITTYKISAVTPKLEFEELCVGVGGKCGGTFIDRKFNQLLARRFGDAYRSVPDDKKGPGSTFMNNFEKVKLQFGYDNDLGSREIEGLKLNVPNSKYYDREERIVVLTYSDMKNLFDPVLAEITRLIAQQVTEVQELKSKGIDRIILVGGFSESPYLNTALKAWCRENGNIRLMCPENPQAAVVRGATIRGLEGLAPRMKKSRLHYGFSCSKPFRKGIDPDEKAFIDNISNERYCNDRMTWVTSKGDAIVPGTNSSYELRHEYSPCMEVSISVILYSSAAVEQAEYDDSAEVQRVGVITGTLPSTFDFKGACKSNYNSRLKKRIFYFECEVQVTFGNKGENLQCAILVNDKVVGEAEITFPHN